MHKMLDGYDPFKPFPPLLDSTIIKDLHTSYLDYQKLGVLDDFRERILRVQDDWKSLDIASRTTAFHDYLREFREQQDATSRALSLSVGHTLDNFSAIQQAAADAIAPWKQLHEQNAWRESLAERLSMRPHLWTINDLSPSVGEGFARLSRLSDAVHDDQPFAEPVDQLLEEEFGPVAEAIEGIEDATERDAAAIAAGLNPQLIDFEQSTYSEVLVCAGFQFYLPALPMPVPVEGDLESASYDRDAAGLISHIERALRLVIVQRLSAAAGARWIKQRVPVDLRQRWAEREQEARGKGRPVFELIEYADFFDLRTLIQRTDNWEAFKDIFVNKDDILESLRRLPDVRNDGAHSRPIGMVDKLLLANEATRILGALRRAGFPV